MPPSRAGPPPAVAPAYSGVWAATRLLRGRRRRRRSRWLRGLTPHPPLPRPGLTPGVRRANVRQAILNAARVLFAQAGYSGLSMRRLADSIGYAPRTIYLYFADKDDLLAELIEEELGRLVERLEAAAAEHPEPGRRLAAVATAYVVFGLAHPPRL